ncbi:MAG: hypothetical protein ABFS35_21175 [Bacteroidota bacterium]
MRKLVLFTVFITMFVNYSIAQTSYGSKDRKKQFFLNISKKHCTDALSILKSDKKGNYTRYARGKKKEDLIESFNTVVHETLHGYNFDIGGFNGEGYYFGSGIELLVPKTEIINSNKLNNFVSKEKQKKCDRYAMYIGNKKPFFSSQVDGIYGLLNEFSAYYHGLKAEIEIRNAGLTCPTFEWQSNNLEAYYEFKLFISWYLQMCKRSYPKIYKNIYANNKLRVAYTLFNTQFTELANEIIQSKSLSPHYTTKVAKLFTSTDKKELLKFEIPEVTIENYKEYFK